MKRDVGIVPGAIHLIHHRTPMRRRVGSPLILHGHLRALKDVPLGMRLSCLIEVLAEWSYSVAPRSGEAATICQHLRRPLAHLVRRAGLGSALVLGWSARLVSISAQELRGVWLILQWVAVAREPPACP